MMLLGWPLTILLVIAIVAIIVLYMQGEARHRQRKIDIIQKQIADKEARLEAEKAAAQEAQKETKHKEEDAKATSSAKVDGTGKSEDN